MGNPCQTKTLLIMSSAFLSTELWILTTRLGHQMQCAYCCSSSLHCWWNKPRLTYMMLQTSELPLKRSHRLLVAGRKFWGEGSGSLATLGPSSVSNKICRFGLSVLQYLNPCSHRLGVPPDSCGPCHFIVCICIFAAGSRATSCAA